MLTKNESKTLRLRDFARLKYLVKPRMRIKTSRLSVFVANDYKLNSSSVAKESAGTAVESGVLIRINERAFPEI